MNLSLDFDLLLYGVMLAGFGVLAHWLVPDHGYATLVTGVVGGLLMAFWAVLGLRGFRKRIWPIGTLAVLDIALLVQAITTWLAIKRGTTALKPVAVIMTLLLVFGIGELLNFLKEDRRPE